MADHAQVQLGFSLPNNDDDQCSAPECSLELGHQNPNWVEWDGGKIGGKPSWLNPRDLPAATPLRCRGPCGSDQEGNVATALRFIAQLYCPADDATENEAAFHRSLYVFACPTCCSTQTPTKETEGGGSTPPSTHHRSDCIRVLRCQLPKENDFFPATGDEDRGEDWTKHTSQYWAKSTNNDKLNLCAVCGQQSKGKCPKQQLWFCGPDHQKECLRASKQVQQKNPSPKYFPSVCHESELVVEDEPPAAALADTTDSTLFQSQDITDDDADLEQSDLNALTGNVSLAQAATGVTDPTTLAFYARMAIGGKENDVRDQCLRYSRWPAENKSKENSDDEDDEDDKVGPLWLSSNNRPPPPTVSSDSTTTSSFPPPCQYCGAPRAFEFQILPQMLHYLLQSPDSTTAATDDGQSNEKSRHVLTESERAILLEAKSKIESGMDLPEGFREQHEAAVANAREALLGISDNNSAGAKKEGLDWGTIAVYTCTASCGDGKEVSGEENGAYLEEAAWMQPPLD
ncbi:hypothetical protein ACHAXR_002862 [Thalassiosira sp. AJA248-18]